MFDGFGQPSAPWSAGCADVFGHVLDVLPLPHAWAPMSSGAVGRTAPLLAETAGAAHQSGGRPRAETDGRSAAKGEGRLAAN